MECLLLYLSMMTVPHIMVGLERMLDYRGVELERFHCIYTGRLEGRIPEGVSFSTTGSSCLGLEYRCPAVAVQ